MKLKYQQEIEQIIKDAEQGTNPLLETQRLNKLFAIIMSEVTDKLSTIWIINAKIDKLFKELMELKYGK